MKYRQLGETDLTVSVIALGCWSLIGDMTWGRQEAADSLATITAALNAGINFFDTAAAYGDGESEMLLGKVLAAQRQEVVIASKVLPAYDSPADIISNCEQSLRRLHTDYIDLYQLHWASPTVPLADAVGALQTLQRQGKIRYSAVCNFGAKDLSDLLALGPVVSNQLPYNLLWRAIEYEIQPLCLKNSVGILAYTPQAQGLLTGKFASPDEVPDGRARTRHFSKDRPLTRHGEAGCEAETFKAIKRIDYICHDLREPMGRVALAWLLHQPGVNSVLAGARRPEQVNQNAEAAELVLPADVVQELAEVTGDLKKKLGPNPDMWASVSRFH